MAQWDKLHHLVAYAALALPVMLARPPRWPLVLMGFLAFSGAIELIQPQINRHGEWSDMVANALGLAIGSLCAALLRHGRTGSGKRRGANR